jgi:hypothetical protein
VLVAVLSIFPIARNAVGLDAVPISVVVPCTTSLDESKVVAEVPIRAVEPKKMPEDVRLVVEAFVVDE